MKIVALLGSPRTNGNTATLTKTFNKTAEELGADVQTFLLNKLDAKGCQACDACKTKTDHCVIKDDLTDVLESVKNADVLVAATPIYFADISAQFKIFVDRCYSYLEPFKTMPKASRLEFFLFATRGDLHYRSLDVVDPKTVHLCCTHLEPRLGQRLSP